MEAKPLSELARERFTENPTFVTLPAVLQKRDARRLVKLERYAGIPVVKTRFGKEDIRSDSARVRARAWQNNSKALKKRLNGTNKQAEIKLKAEVRAKRAIKLLPHDNQKQFSLAAPSAAFPRDQEKPPAKP